MIKKYNSNIELIRGIILQNEELVLNILRNTDKVKSQKNLAQDLGFSVGKINYVLKALINKGLIKAENFVNSENKKQYKYLLTEEGVRKKIYLTEKFIERKKQEYEELQKELDLIKGDMK